MVVFLGLGRMDYTRLATAGSTWMRSPITWLLVAAAGSCMLVLLPIPYLSMQVNGARRWLRLGPVQLQASELAKWATVLFLAYWLSNRPVDLNRYFRGFLPTLIPVGFLCLLVVTQDFGTAALIDACALTI